MSAEQRFNPKSVVPEVPVDIDSIDLSNWDTSSFQDARLVLAENAATSQVTDLGELAKNENKEELLAAMSTFAKVRTLLTDHPYVSVELPVAKKGDPLLTLHMTRVEGDPNAISAHVVSSEFTSKGARYSEMHERTFFQSNAEVEGDPAVANIKQYVDSAFDFVLQRHTMKHVVQWERQGFFERKARVDLGLEDTGGETKYVDETSVSLAKLDFVTTVINQGGPKHPTNHDVREGMHYGRDCVDTLFVPNKEKSFVAKEDAHPEYDFSNNPAPGEAPMVKPGIYEELVRKSLHHLRDRNIDGIIGHYTCGAACAQLMHEMRGETGKPVPTPPVWVIHSLGSMKEADILESGKEVDDSLNIRRRIEMERQLAKKGMLAVAVSTRIRDYAKRDGIKIEGMYPAGIDPNQFFPMAPDMRRSDPMFKPIMTRLAMQMQKSRSTDPDRFDAPTSEEVKAGISLLTSKYAAEYDRLCKATIMTETSRCVEAKGKDNVVRAFAEARRQLPGTDLMLVINIERPDINEVIAQDPERANALVQKEVEHIQMLHAEIERLGLKNHIVIQTTFSNEDVALVNRIAKIYMSDPETEPWGMSVQQGGASGCLVIAGEHVSMAMEVLRGSEPEVREVSIQANGKESNTHYEIGEGAVLVQHGDYRAAAGAIVDYVRSTNSTDSEEGSDREHFQRVQREGHNICIERTWDKLSFELTSKMGFEFEVMGSPREWKVLPFKWEREEDEPESNLSA